MSTFGITGATGQLGRKVIASLSRQTAKEQIVAIVRDPAKAADLNVATRVGDYGDRSGLVDALTGLDSLLLISSSSVGTRQAEHANVIAAAQQAGVRRVVYTSLLHAERWRIGFADDHLATEQWLKESGLDFTVLRNGWYWENHTAGLVQALDHGGIVSGAGDAPISWASRQDYADAAVAVLLGAGHAGKTYELAGIQSHTLTDLAAEVSRQTGRAFGHRQMTEAQYAVFLESVGLPPPVAAMLAEIDSRGVARGVLAGDHDSLSTLIGRPTMSLATAVAAALGR
jgi:NAD(P)H dehydrogenase (quinone)